MRNKYSEPKISVRAIAGSGIVALAGSLKKAEFDTRDLLGFAVERTEFGGAAVVRRPHGGGEGDRMFYGGLHAGEEL